MTAIILTLSKRAIGVAVGLAAGSGLLIAAQVQKNRKNKFARKSNISPEVAALEARIEKECDEK